ncbi:DUF928 domain-containing protein [Pantanalinema sp. GBBB05]|uniref:DUF928 domain-containing protein n=1 Tax=Pantanalinema sp. GBBB05 TaxID=2604139 RepID=UPI003D81BC08
MSSPPPPRPTKSRPLGGLGNVCDGEKTIIALIPDGQRLLVTLSFSPTFWFYIPYQPEQIDSIEFTINSFDEKTQIYRSRIEAPSTSGVIGLQLPPSVKLETNQTYYWYFQLNCKRKQGKPISEKVEGHVSVLPPTPERVNMVERMDSKIVYDALTIAADRRSKKLPGAEQDWQRLLNSLGKGNLATEPILPLRMLPKEN